MFLPWKVVWPKLDQPDRFLRLWTIPGNKVWELPKTQGSTRALMYLLYQAYTSKEQWQTLQKVDDTLEKIRQVVWTNPNGTSWQFYEKIGCSIDGGCHHLAVLMEWKLCNWFFQYSTVSSWRVGVSTYHYFSWPSWYKNKITQQILQQFYWLMLCKDVKDYSRK